MQEDFDQLDPKKYILIKGAKVNNLKELDVAIPRNNFVVITGVSGSGKSSLAFDTLYAEGQRMYVESLSAYVRQFLGRMEKPEVEYIKGISPAIAIEQKVSSKNPRSTVGTTTEIYDYLKLLFARIGKTISPESGKEVKKDTVTEVVDYIHSFEEGTRVQISCPLVRTPDRSVEDELKVLMQKGFNRIMLEDEMVFIEDLDSSVNLKEAEILIDRLTVKKDDEDNQYRMADSVQTAFFEGEGSCLVHIPGKDKKSFSDKFELDGIKFEEPSVNLFSFNNPYGACRRCEGFGNVLGIDPDLVIPDKNLSVYEGAILPWRSEKMKNEWLQPLLKNGIRFDFPIHRVYKDLTEDEKELLWTGNSYFKGLNQFFNHLESKVHKIQYRVLLSRYRGKTLCPDCKGTRLRKDAGYVKVGGSSIQELVLLPVDEVSQFFGELQLSEHDLKVGKRIFQEIKNRLDYLLEVGLGYLTLNRLTNSLSGGEYQRIKLATSLGSALVGSMYILDEPSIGLHPRDTNRLIKVLKNLKAQGNTVIIVEHEEEVMRSADQIIDIGPEAGSHGGELIWQGSPDELVAGVDSLTAKYLFGELTIDVPEKRRPWKKSFEVTGAYENNLKHIDVKIPLHVLTVISGVSGSGKSTLIKKIIYPALKKMKEGYEETTGKFSALQGDYTSIDQVEFVDQNPIGKSSRSNPVTYIKAYDLIRQLYADQPLSKQRGYKPAHFSFNVEGGRCETCLGEGVQHIEMQFMADIELTCETCKGKRFKKEVLEVEYNGKNIYDVLDMTVSDALEFFREESKIAEKLHPLERVGLGYVRLGQSSNTLSGGEAQRVKLAFFLSKESQKSGHVLFIFDEPTTGLHFHDIEKLLKSVQALIDMGHSVVIIEHNLDVIKSADWLIDLGPEGGKGGGEVVYEGTPEGVIDEKKSYTGKFLADKLAKEEL